MAKGDSIDVCLANDYAYYLEKERLLKAERAGDSTVSYEITRGYRVEVRFDRHEYSAMVFHEGEQIGNVTGPVNYRGRSNNDWEGIYKRIRKPAVEHLAKSTR